MRLQSAIFTMDDALLLTQTAQERETLEKVLALFKMEGVWLAAVTAQEDECAQRALSQAGLAGYFRAVLSERVALCKADSGTMFERAMKRLRSQKGDTVVFTASLSAVEQAKAAGFRTVAIRAGAAEENWEAMKAAATESLASYGELLEKEA